MLRNLWQHQRRYFRNQRVTYQTLHIFFRSVTYNTKCRYGFEDRGFIDTYMNLFSQSF